MYTAQDFNLAIKEYIDFNLELQKNVGMVRGIMKIFGFGSGVERDPRHEEFFTEMKNTVRELCDSNPDPETAGAVIDTVFQTRPLYSDLELDDTIFAAIEYTAIDLIPFLSQEKAAEVLQSYQKTNPRTRRFPAQNKIVAALKERAGRK